MISILRDFTKSWIFTLLMGLLIASFAVFGLRDVFGSVGDTTVVTAGARDVSTTDFKRLFDNWQTQASQRNGGQSVSAQDFVDNGMHLQMLSEIADDTALDAWLDQQGIKASPKLVVDQVAKNSAFFNQVTGKFDKAAYVGILREHNMDEKTYEDSITDEISKEQYANGAFAGIRAPRISAALQAAFVLQSRDASVFMLSPDDVVNPPAQPSDADLRTFYAAHQVQLTLPELRQGSLILFSAGDQMKTIPIDEAALQKAYKFELDSLSTPETRSFVEVTAPDTASAAAISAALKAGQDPNAVAKANKGVVIPYDMKPKTAVPDTKIADAAFALHTGDVSGPISGELGIAVIKMGDIKIGSTPTYASVRDQLVTEYQKNKAADKLSEVVNAYQKAHEGGEDFEVTAKRMGLQIRPMAPATLQGATANPQQNYSKYPEVMKDLYDLEPGGTSDVEELPNGDYFALRLDKVMPAGVRPFDEVKAELVGPWRADKMAAAINAKSQEVLAQLKAGKSINDIAASLGTKAQPMLGVDRNAINTKKIPQQFSPLLGQIFNVDQGQAFAAPIDQLHVFIGRVDAVHQADPKMANMVTSTMRNQVNQSLAQDFTEASRTSARLLIKPKTYPNNAIRALGLTPPDPKAKGAASSKAAG